MKTEKLISRALADEAFHKVMEDYLESADENKANFWREYKKLTDDSGFGRTEFYKALDRLVDPVEEAYRKKGVSAGARVAKEINEQFRVQGIYSLAEHDALSTPIALCHPTKDQYIGTPRDYFSISVKNRGILGHVVDVSGAGERSAMVINLMKQSVLPKPHLKELYGMTNDNPFYGRHDLIKSDPGSAFACTETLRFALLFLINLAVNPSGKPWKNPFIERWNFTFVQLFVSKMPGYLPNPKAYGDRVKDLRSKATLDPFEYEVLSNRFIFDKYHMRPHRGLLGKSPLEALREDRMNPKSLLLSEPSLPFRAEDMRDYCIPLGKTVAIQDRGIQIDNRIYGSSETTTRIARYLSASRRPKRIEPHIDHGDYSYVKVKDPQSKEDLVVPFKFFAPGVDADDRWDPGVSTLRSERLEELASMETDEILEVARFRKKSRNKLRKEMRKRNTPGPISADELSTQHAAIAFAKPAHHSLIPEVQEEDIERKQIDVATDEENWDLERERKRHGVA
ncbi:hypothetical protein BST95_12690 [Halioglobus japonicus]|uniref:Integrase catalytic domain-containing protein n=1 Tax=Halioglobus japonicus TaxID=930805 RepID=A0AAP8MHK8_9GAMM|nr:hypothetical protein [Halioglobus japonicus]AQA18972.1 hypothetical protein BST95_12690 [Halioglobus japonicus]PLW88013.1 hypothetical protein C0029_05495 [Halioglobus japonicus]GHD20457.1 hypothetical protein GCM10007052_30090 [Halioglobus japonicus]